MSWISTNNLRRFADKLFHGNLSFGGSVTHNGATTFNGGVKVNTTKAEFAAPVSFTGTTTYKGNEIATKADVTTSDLTPYMKKDADSDLNMDNHAIFIGDSSIDGSTGDFMIQTIGGVNIITGGDNRYLSVNGDDVATQNYVMGRIPTKTSQLTNDANFAKTSYLPTKTSQLTNDSGYAVMSNGHLGINGSELWIE